MERWVGAVRGSRLRTLIDTRGIHEDVLIDAEVGWDADRREHPTRRYCFPIRHVRTGVLLETDH